VEVQVSEGLVYAHVVLVEEAEGEGHAVDVCDGEFLGGEGGREGGREGRRCGG
jgi:hypothetical protein